MSARPQPPFPHDSDAPGHSVPGDVRAVNPSALV